MDRLRLIGGQPCGFILLMLAFALAQTVHAQSWIKLAPTGTLPIGRMRQSGVYDPNTNRMIVFGGNPGNATVLNDVWVLTNANGLGGPAAWIQLTPSGVAPQPRELHAAVYDSVSNRMIVFGGGGYAYHNDVWILTNANGLGGTPAWIQLLPVGPLPAGRQQMQSVYDQKNNRMILFGGTVVGNVPANDSWVLTNANGLASTTPTWINLSPSGSIPTARQGDSLSYDAINNLAVLFGGTLLNDLWTLSNANGLGQPGWTELLNNGSAGAIPARDGVDTTYDTVNSRLTAFGGCVGSGTCVPANDVWVLSNANGVSGSPTWTQLTPAGTLPEPRFWYAATYDQTSNRMTVFGGADDPSIFLNDVWVLTNANGLGSSQLGVTEILPNHGGSAGMVTAELIGAGFQSGASVRLTGSGPDIAGTNTTIPNAAILTTTFDLTGAAPGARTVVVTNMDNSSLSVPDGFIVEQGGAPNIQVDIIGRDKIRIGSPQTYYVQLSNIGNVDSPPGLVSLNLPSAVAFQQLNGSDLFIGGSTSDSFFQIPSSDSTVNQSLLFATPGVSAGSIQYAPTQLTLPTESLELAALSEQQGPAKLTSRASASPQFALTAAWQQDLARMSLDDFLGLENTPFIPYPTAGCSQCLSNYSSELLAYSNVGEAYFAYQTARQKQIDAYVNLPLAFGKTVGAALAVTALGVEGLGGVVLSSAIAQAVTCAQSLLPSVAESCIPNTAVIFTTIRDAAKNCIENPPGLPCLKNPPQDPRPVFFALEALTTAVDTLVAASDALADIVNAYGAEQAAFGTFQQSLGPYRVARANYRACLSPTVCQMPLPQPTANPPGTTSLPVTGVGSLDPNDKTGTHGIGSQQYVPGSTPLNYSVDFGNEATATAPAQKVTVTDQLDVAHDDLTTVSLGSMTFGNELISPPPLQNTFSTIVDLRPATNLLVSVSANLSSAGLLSWNFASLDPATGLAPTDPTIGFLPPGINGNVFFSVNPKQNLTTGTQISNQATIVFDANAAIPTPAWTNALDNTPPISHMTPLPAQSGSTFNVQWSGTDIGAGVQSFTIYVSDNGSSFVPWLIQTTATFGSYSGQVRHTYDFYSIAQDLVGNIEGAKTSAEATTQVTQAGPLSSVEVSVTASGLTYSRVSQTFNGTMTIQNVSDSTIYGPFEIVFTALTSGVTLANTTNTFNGLPYLTVPAVTSLAPGQPATVSIQFKNPANKTINFAPVIYSGSLN